jgi:hypothetical protein
VRRPSAGARTWLPLRAEARRLRRNSNLEESVVEEESRCKEFGMDGAGGVNRGWRGPERGLANESRSRTAQKTRRSG